MSAERPIITETAPAEEQVVRGMVVSCIAGPCNMYVTVYTPEGGRRVHEIPTHLEPVNVHKNVALRVREAHGKLVFVGLQEA